ncbi:hypothetical protein [uncultured Ramlibacter sp.]|uniref:hypothetical protein n=1 Tax=uncultured Ramlibacter sp. TaxID=260755 RepID=UPI00262F3C73|nr:hypothetical protein [uncultured Ramlibacter sp.]
MDYLTEVLAHLAWMARMPGAKAHAWHRAQELAKLDPMFGDLPARLTEAMQSHAASFVGPVAASQTL